VLTSFPDKPYFEAVAEITAEETEGIKATITHLNVWTIDGTILQTSYTWADTPACDAILGAIRNILFHFTRPEFVHRPTKLTIKTNDVIAFAHATEQIPSRINWHNICKRKIRKIIRELKTLNTALVKIDYDPNLARPAKRQVQLKQYTYICPEFDSTGEINLEAKWRQNRKTRRI